MKVKFYDGSEIEVQNSSSENCFVVLASDHAEVELVLAKLTNSNLSSYQFIDNEMVVATYTEKTFDKITVVYNGGFIVSFNVRNFTETEKQINDLTTAVLEMSEIVYSE